MDILAVSNTIFAPFDEPPDSSPPPTPPSASEQGVVMGSLVGGMTDSTVHTTLGMECY